MLHDYKAILKDIVVIYEDIIIIRECLIKTEKDKRVLHVQEIFILISNGDFECLKENLVNVLNSLIKIFVYYKDNDFPSIA